MVVSREEKGDVTDYLTAEGGTSAGLKEMIRDTVPIYAPWVKIKNGEPNGINGDILSASVSKTLDYIMLRRQGFDMGEFYVFNNGVYKKCSKLEFKGCIKSYIPVGMATDNLLNNVYNLISCGQEKVFEFEEANGDESIINVKNGLLDINTMELRPHSKDCISTIQLNCNYNKNAKAHRFIGFINSLCSDENGEADREKAAVLQEWMGLALSNIPVHKVKKCLVLYSALGNTGKSVFLNVISSLIGGENTINIPIQNMSDRFALSDMYGKRLDIVGDQRADDIEDSSGFKQLTGGDRLKVEFKGKQSFDWIFRGGILISCNDLPCFKDDKGGHIFERMDIVPCVNEVKKQDRDGELLDKLLKEADGIFMWAMDGLKRLKDNKLKFTECEAGKAVLNEYRGNIDTLYKFMSEYYEITGDVSDRVKKTEFENDYLRWCRDNDYTPLKQRNIKERASKNGVELGKYAGIYCYKGIKMNTSAFYTVEEPNEYKQEEIPF